MKIYISGKITGNPHYIEQFEAIENMLTSEGYEVVNPAELLQPLPAETNYNTYMRMSMNLLSECDAIYLQTNWINSNGAKQEREYAIEHNYLMLMGGDVK